ncbi:hypothetical protein [Primorskyibacter sp. S87]|uniref:hypothetical protein n=1 Tax=Primorskyibacter sp. S87 TaxID=3415126 RepID=UPI003C7C8A42
MTRYSKEELDALLVFYANGSLTGAERTAIEDALEQDPDLRDDLRHLVLLRDEMRDEDPGLANEIAFHRIMQEIDTTPQDAPTENGEAEKRPRISIARWIAALALIALVTQSVVLWRNSLGYQLASNDAQTDIIVAFHPSVSEGDIRDLLLELDLQIVSGPSSLGLYGLNADNPSAALAALKAHSAVVESAQDAMD